MLEDPGVDTKQFVFIHTDADLCALLYMAHKVAPETDTEVWQIDMRPQIYAFEKLTI